MIKDNPNIPATTFALPAYLDALRKLLRKHRRYGALEKRQQT